jgi:hypothetical protein
MQAAGDRQIEGRNPFSNRSERAFEKAIVGWKRFRPGIHHPLPSAIPIDGSLQIALKRLYRKRTIEVPGHPKLSRQFAPDRALTFLG